MSKRKTIDAFLKKKDVSNSKFRTLVAVEINRSEERRVGKEC